MGTATTTRGRLLIVSGLVLVGVLFVWYDRYQDPGALTPEAISTIHWLAHMFYLLLVACLGMVALGMYLFHKSAVGGSGGLVGVIAEATWNGRSRRIFVVVFVVYGVFFSMASGTLVYQPQVDFAAHYGAQIPSWFIAPCCGDPGYMPTIIVYLSNHIGLQVLPLNLVLQVVVSYLVGLNAALAAVAYAASRGARGAGAVGALTGLFVACPTCAGTASSIFIGTAGGIALSIALAQLQTLFIAVSIPVLVATPFLLARQLRSCRVR